MQLEHLFHNHQQNPPIYIYTNPHNHNIHQISPIHKITKSHIQLCHNSSTIQFQISQVCIHQTHLSSTFTIHMQQQDNISICNAPILDTYMHVVPDQQQWMQQKHPSKSTPPLTCKSTPPLTTTM
jgi:hypothetical protein